MPRKAKDETILIEEKEVKNVSNSKKLDFDKEEKAIKSTDKTTSSKATNSKKSIEKASKKEANITSKTTKKVDATSSKSKKTTSKNDEKTTKKAGKSTVSKSSEKSNTKDSTTKKTAKTTSVKKATSKSNTASSKRRTNKNEKIEILEYYDLPYRYNQTVVKVLAQTPNILFVYWDISDEDKQNYINQYGQYFFNDTKPVLIVYNNTMHYSFEVEINDFANSWYLHIADSNCDYRVELGRRPINKYAKINNYLYISSSNSMDAPNDHILFDSLNNNVYFRNIKTNITTKKDISLSFFSKIGKIYNVKDFYKNLYKDETIDFDKLNLRNMPSS